MLGDSEDVVLAIAPGSRRAFQQHDHRLPRDHHAGLQHRGDVLAKLDRRLAPAIVAEHTEAVAVAE